MTEKPLDYYRDIPSRCSRSSKNPNLFPDYCLPRSVSESDGWLAMAGALRQVQERVEELSIIVGARLDDDSDAEVTLDALAQFYAARADEAEQMGYGYDEKETS